MTWLPNSLLGRNVLLLVTLIVVGQALAGLVFRQMVQAPFIDRLAVTLANDLIAVRAGMATLPPEQLAQFIQAFNATSQAHHLGQPEAMIPLPVEQRLIRKTSALLAEQGIQAIWRSEAGNAFYVRLQIDGQSHWLSTVGLASGMLLPRAALISWLVGMGLAVLGAFLIQRRINRPLTQLVQATHATSRGEFIEPLAERGPHEIAEVCRAFNRMQAELADQNQQRTLMLAGVSHDLRTPLTKIRLAAEILRDQADAALIDSIARSCHQIEVIIDQFVDFAGIGNSEPTAVIDLDRLIAELIQELDAPFALQLEPIPPLTLRPQALRRALTNLIENALRYAQPDYGIVTAAQGKFAVILVQDRGPGIPADRVGELLKPFTRGSAARNGPAGAGLGLAIAARIVHMEGGRMTLGERSGGGLEVRLELPFQREAPTAPRTDSSSKTPGRS
ncbi:MAG TPA: ATP-binding protein [Candidatus Competibacteraceae bacterium]|nr:ATP-binding protein [Candidatus Competibacteraceae bacterium]